MPDPGRDSAALGDMRPGSLIHRHMMCGSPAYRC